MGVSIGAVELNSVAAGVVAGDVMLKAANVELVVAQPTCPGKFIVIVAGDTSSVETAVAAGKYLQCGNCRSGGEIRRQRQSG